jgi:hypothetical protein
MIAVMRSVATFQGGRPVRDLEAQLRRWLAAGLISADQLGAIVAYEASDATPRRRSTLGAEALGYVGAALAVGALALLLGELWSSLVLSGRLALVGLLTVLLATGGSLLRRAASASIQRLASVLFTGAVLGVGWLAFIVGGEVLTLSEPDLALFIGLTTGAVSLLLYLTRPRPLHQLTLLVTILLVTTALLTRPSLPPSQGWIGLTFWGLGVAWLLLGAGGWLVPRPLAEVLGGIVALIAAQAGSFDDRLPMLLLGVATAGALVGLAIATDRIHDLAVGAVGLFVLVPQVVFELFGDAIGAPATLLVVGLLMVLLAVGLGRARRELGSAGGPRPGSDPGDGPVTGPASDPTPSATSGEVPARGSSDLGGHA